MKTLYWKLAKAIWQLRKKYAMWKKRAVPEVPGLRDPTSPYYIDPEKYGCKPGVITWPYLKAVYYQTFPEMKSK